MLMWAPAAQSFLTFPMRVQFRPWREILLPFMSLGDKCGLHQEELKCVPRMEGGKESPIYGVFSLGETF